MGKILKTKKLTTLAEGIILVFGLAIVLTGVYFFAPGLHVSQSKQLKSLDLSGDNINNNTKGAELPVAGTQVSSSVSKQPLMRIAEYAWNGNAGMIAANGGPRTTEGSLIEKANVNLEIVRLDGVNDLRNMQIKFVEEFSKGIEYPTSEKSAFAVSIMGDGAPFYITTTQKSLDEKFGKGKFHVQNIAAIGMSFGEDKLIGPKIWKDNPQSLKGSVISAVIGDGDWVVAVNFCSANNVPVNPDPTTYDANAVNFASAPNDDYIEAVKDLVKSQKTGYSLPLKEVINGKLTGKTINHKIDGAVTWTPGDKLAFDALSGFTDVVSTKDFMNQMPTSVIVIKEWATQHDKQVIALLKATYEANNQIKLYDKWAVRASEGVAKTYNFETPKYWYDLFKGQKGTKDGIDYNIGGSKVLNYADALQYFGVTDGNNRYKAVYNQVSLYLTDLNPCDFNGTCKEGVVGYEDAVNLYFLKSVTDVDAGTTTKQDYTANKTQVMADGQWHINFSTGSAQIAQIPNKDLEEVYNLLVQAEQTKVKIVGHTDNTGNSDANVTLSLGRAKSVSDYLVGKGLPKERIQLVDGKGSSEPISDNKTDAGRAKNRRVEITILK